MSLASAMNQTVIRCNSERRGYEAMTKLLNQTRRSTDVERWNGIWEGWYALGRVLKSTQERVAKECAPWFEAQR